MPTKDQAKTIKNYIEVFFAAFLIVSSLSFLVWNQGNHFSNSGAIAFFIAGVSLSGQTGSTNSVNTKSRSQKNEKIIFDTSWCHTVI